ncbi:MAG: urea ABC transporter permease subunit UrtB, partial [Ferrovibrio sp.]
GAPSGNDIALSSPLDGSALGVVAASELDPLFVNNNLRNVLREAVGRLGLGSADPAARRTAANALLDNATPEAVALLREAYGRETVDSVKSVMALSLAAAEIAHPDKVKRMDAIAVLGSASDLRVRALLQARLNQEQDADVKAALVKA